MGISCCGQNCTECEAFLAYQNDDSALRAKTALLWSERYNHPFKPEDINCTGCREEGVKIGHCHECNIRSCCMDKDLKNCGVCEEYACDKLEEFFRIIPPADAAHNRKRLEQ